MFRAILTFCSIVCRVETTPVTNSLPISGAYLHGAVKVLVVTLNLFTLVDRTAISSDVGEAAAVGLHKALART